MNIVYEQNYEKYKNKIQKCIFSTVDSNLNRAK